MEQRILGMLGRCKTTAELRHIHAKILRDNLKDSDFIAPKLITLYSQLYSIEAAAQVFHSLTNPNVIAYNSMINCYVGKSHRAPLLAYNGMKASMVVPNSFTYTVLFKCLESFEALELGRMLQTEILKSGSGCNVFVQNTLLSFYAKGCGDLESACMVFDEMPVRDVVSWNSMISAYMGRGLIDSAIGLLNSMPEKNSVTWNTVISGLCKAGKMEMASSIFVGMADKNELTWNSMISGFVKVGNMNAAKSIFMQMPSKTVVSWTAMVSGFTSIDLDSAKAIFDQMPEKNTVSWNAMITGYVHNRKFDQALTLFHQMLSDGTCKPDQTTLITALSACSHLGSLEHGKWIDSYIKKHELDLSLSLGNALIDMFSKCGDLKNAKAVFDTTSRRCVITWTSMVSGLAFNGQCREAIALYDRMCREGLRPDNVIFIAVLTACTHGGLVEEGKRIFSQMVKEYRIEPRIEHYGCMVDLLGKAGKLSEAFEFIGSMHLEPNAVIWASLISSCKIHGSHEVVDFVVHKIMEKEPSNPSYLMLISNLRASVGQNDESSTYRLAMREQGVEKLPGCSSIQVGNTVHEFLSRDTGHDQREEIYRILFYLDQDLKNLSDGVEGIS